jgi:flagellar hook-associated protein 2
MIEQINRFVEKYNDVQAALDDATSFDPETFERGPLFGDPTVNLIRTRLHRTMARAFEGADPSVSRLFAVGLRLGGDNRLEFDEQKFRDTYEQSPELVERLFTTDDTGFGAVLDEALDELTRDFDGVIARKDDVLSSQQDLLNGRIDQLNVLLDAKRARLEAQFVALESALAVLQDQQNALMMLSQSTGNTGL